MNRESAVDSENSNPKTIIDYHARGQTEKTIIDFHEEFEHAQSK